MLTCGSPLVLLDKSAKWNENPAAAHSDFDFVGIYSAWVPSRIVKYHTMQLASFKANCLKRVKALI